MVLFDQNAMSESNAAGAAVLGVGVVDDEDDELRLTIAASPGAHPSLSHNGAGSLSSETSESTEAAQRGHQALHPNFVFERDRVRSPPPITILPVSNYEAEELPPERPTMVRNFHPDVQHQNPSGRVGQWPVQLTRTGFIQDLIQTGRRGFVQDPEAFKHYTVGHSAGIPQSPTQRVERDVTSEVFRQAMERVRQELPVIHTRQFPPELEGPNFAAAPRGAICTDRPNCLSPEKKETARCPTAAMPVKLQPPAAHSSHSTSLSSMPCCSCWCHLKAKSNWVPHAPLSPKYHSRALDLTTVQTVCFWRRPENEDKGRNEGCW